MSKTQEKQIYDLDDFPNHCHLWSIVSGGDSKGILLLRKLVDSVQANSYSRPGSRLPSILITGTEGKQLVAKALVNSLAIVDARFCHAKYMDNGVGSCQFFNDSLTNTAHIITHIEQLTPTGESVIWRYLTTGFCNHYSFTTKKYDTIQYCNGLIILTAKDIKSVPEPIIKAVGHTIKLQEFTKDQLCLLVHQQLKFCGIKYTGEQVLQEIVGDEPHNISLIMQSLRTCILMLRAEFGGYLTMEIVKKADRLCSLPVPPHAVNDNIKF